MKNFAAQPESGGMIEVLTAQDLTTDVTKFDVSKIFTHAPLFADNCDYCTNPTVMNLDGIKMNAEGFKNFDVMGTLQWGADLWSTDQQRKTAEEQARLALQIEQTRLAAERAKAQADMQKSSTVVSQIKAYATPILIGGIVVIGGISAYFYFKKKKAA